MEYPPQGFPIEPRADGSIGRNSSGEQTFEFRTATVPAETPEDANVHWANCIGAIHVFTGNEKQFSRKPEPIPVEAPIGAAPVAELHCVTTRQKH